MFYEKEQIYMIKPKAGLKNHFHSFFFPLFVVSNYTRGEN